MLTYYVVNVNLKVPDEDKWRTPLQAAAVKGHEKAVELLLNAGANVDVHCESGTALQLAAAGGYEKVAQMLLEAGADANSERETEFARWRTALQAAANNCHEGMLELLLKAKANPNVGLKFYMHYFTDVRI